VPTAEPAAPPLPCLFRAGDPVTVLPTDGRQPSPGHVLSIHRHAAGWELVIAVFATACTPARTVNVVVSPPPPESPAGGVMTVTSLTAVIGPHPAPAVTEALDRLATAGADISRRVDADLPGGAVIITRAALRVLVTTTPADGLVEVWPYLGRGGIAYVAFVPPATDWLTALLTRRTSPALPA
jgi:hypothetical protein